MLSYFVADQTCAEEYADYAAFGQCAGPTPRGRIGWWRYQT